MSHVASVECILKDLDAMKAAGERLGFEFMEGQKTHRWFGRFMNDWASSRAAVKKGVDPATFGKCTHALRMKAAPTGYEIGVTALEDGAYRLVYDAYGSGGQQIEKLAGVDLAYLHNEISAEVATRTLRGYRIRREQVSPAHIRLIATR